MDDGSPRERFVSPDTSGLNRKAMSIPPLKYCLGFPVLTVLFSVCFLTVSGLANPLPPIQAVRWEPDLNVATARAEREQRPLFLHFVGNDSPAAQQMANEIFVQPTIAAHLNANFVMVRVDAVENSALAQRFSVTAIPTDLIVRPNGHIIHRRVGVITADRFAQYLAFLQETMQSEKNPVSAHISNPPQITGAFPVVNPQVSSHQIPPPPATPSGTMLPNAVPHVMPSPQQETFATVPGVMRDSFMQPPSAGQHPPVMQQQMPFAHQPQRPQAVVGVMASPMSSANNPLRTAELAARPGPEQGIVPAPPTTTAIQAMLATPAPPKKTVEVPLALEGFCPVILCTEERWVTGNPAYCTMYHGHVFRFSSKEALAVFAQNPANYTPVAMGEDIVLKVDRNRRVNGDRRFGAWFQGRVFLFSSQETFNVFEARPDYYAEIASKYEIARREQPAPIVY